MAVAARDEGVEALVNLSQISARQDSESPLARHHCLSENIFDWADINVVHIRPTFFAEMLFILEVRPSRPRVSSICRMGRSDMHQLPPPTLPASQSVFSPTLRCMPASVTS